MKLTLDKSWELCLKQWQWIAKQLRAKKRRSVIRLKDEWCENNGFLGRIDSNCFFCEYDKHHKRGCDSCPARKIDKEFDCCNDKYLFHRNPLVFYAKLKALNRKRNKGV